MSKILMIVGSLRKDSFNRQMSEKAAEILGDQAEIVWLDYADLPYMNQDIEAPVPDSVQRVRDQVSAADGLWIFSPEYNFSFPGVLKNLLDWLSRPVDPTDRKSDSVVIGKPVTVSGAAGRSGAAGVRSALKELLGNMRMEVIGEDGTGVILDKAAFVTGKLSLSDDDQGKLAQQASLFLDALI